MKRWFIASDFKLVTQYSKYTLVIHSMIKFNISDKKPWWMWTFSYARLKIQLLLFKTKTWSMVIICYQLLSAAGMCLIAFNGPCLKPFLRYSVCHFIVHFVINSPVVQSWHSSLGFQWTCFMTHKIGILCTTICPAWVFTFSISLLLQQSMCYTRNPWLL